MSFCEVQLTSHQVGYRTVNKIGFEVYRNVSVSVMSVSLKDKSQYHEYGIYETVKTIIIILSRAKFKRSVAELTGPTCMCRKNRPIIIM